MAKQKIYLGTELKLNLNIERMGSETMSTYDFDVDLYCNPNKVFSLHKSKNKDKDTPTLYREVDDVNYYLFVDTVAVGLGKLKCKVTAFVEDEHFPDGIRTEVVEIDTGIEIVKGL